jgi:hypothetical protein
MKLINLSGTHYIVVDDSEIKEGDNVLDNVNRVWTNIEPCFLKPMLEAIKLGKQEYKPKGKITHSTQPLETSNEEYAWYGGEKKVATKTFDKLKPLAISEVEEAINGCSVEKMAKFHYGQHRKTVEFENGFILGFQIAHQELVKDKVFVDKANIASLQELVDEGYDPYDSAHHIQVQRMLKTVEQFLESLLPKTEWDIEITPEGKIKVLGIPGRAYNPK